MRTERQGQVGMLVLVVIQGVLVLGLAGATAILALKDKKETELLKNTIKSCQPYIDVKEGGTASVPDPGNNPAYGALISKYKSKAESTEKDVAKTTVLTELLANQAELARRLIGKTDTLDADDVAAQLPVLMYPHMNGLKLKFTTNEEVVTSPLQLTHLTVADALRHMRSNYNEKVSELERERAKVTEVLQIDNWKTKLEEVKDINIEGKSNSLLGHLTEKADGAERDPSAIIATLASYIEALDKRAKAAEAKAAAAEQALAVAQNDYKAKIEELSATGAKDREEFANKNTSVSTELDSVKATLAKTVEEKDAEINKLKGVLVNRMRMAPDFLTPSPDLMLEPAGRINTINPTRRTVLLSIRGNIRNRILPGYKFTVYPADPSVPMNKETAKGKVEVVSVTGSFAEAKITDGIKDNVILLAEGDRIANPFVSRVVRHVALIGYFDLDNDGTATKEETKQLIDFINYKWGGRVDMHCLNLDKEDDPTGRFKESTDFIVFGFIPPPITESDRMTEEQRKEAVRVKRLIEKEKEARKLAADWLIPVLSQNRFYDMAGIVSRGDGSALKKY